MKSVLRRSKQSVQSLNFYFVMVLLSMAFLKQVTLVTRHERTKTSQLVRKIQSFCGRSPFITVLLCIYPKLKLSQLHSSLLARNMLCTNMLLLRLFFYFIKKGLTKLNFLMFYSDQETLTLLASVPPWATFACSSVTLGRKRF